MAKYRGSIYGTISGQQLGSVGSTWKGINYVREYVIPNNPKTAAQTTQRAKFANVSEFLRKLVSSVLNPYTIPAPKQMSAYNFAMSNNIPLQTSATFDPLLVKLTKGSLYNPGLTSVYDMDAAGIVAAWGNELVGDALATDVAHLVIYDTISQTFRFVNAVRSAGTVTMARADAGTIAIGDPAYLFFVDALGTAVSDSDSAAITIPG